MINYLVSLVKNDNVLRQQETWRGLLRAQAVCMQTQTNMHTGKGTRGEGKWGDSTQSPPLLWESTMTHKLSLPLTRQYSKDTNWTTSAPFRAR